MPVALSCPLCEASLRLRDDLAGSKVKCPKCKKIIAVPKASPADDKAGIRRGRGGSNRPSDGPRQQKKKMKMTRAWYDLRTTTQFHVPDEGEAGYERDDIATHKRIVAVGKAFAAVGLVVGIVMAIGIIVGGLQTLMEGKPFMDGTPVSIGMLKALPLLILAVIAIPVVCYFYGTSVTLLFAPRVFLAGPIGKKWLKIAGVKSPTMARILCAILLLSSTAIVAVVLGLILMEYDRADAGVAGGN